MVSVLQAELSSPPFYASRSFVAFCLFIFSFSKILDLLIPVVFLINLFIAFIILSILGLSVHLLVVTIIDSFARNCCIIFAEHFKFIPLIIGVHIYYPNFWHNFHNFVLSSLIIFFSFIHIVWNLFACFP